MGALQWRTISNGTVKRAVGRHGYEYTLERSGRAHDWVAYVEYLDGGRDVLKSNVSFADARAAAIVHHHRSGVGVS